MDVESPEQLLSAAEDLAGATAAAADDAQATVDRALPWAIRAEDIVSAARRLLPKEPAAKVAPMFEAGERMVVSALAVVESARAGSTAATAVVTMAKGHVAMQPTAAGGWYQGQDPSPAAAAAASAPAPAPAGKPAKDPLRVGKKIVLGEGETFVGSASTKSEDMGNMMLAAAVDTPDGRVVHVAVPVDDESRKDWKGAHAPTKETHLDEDVDPATIDPDDDPADYTSTVDTYSDVTVVIDADAAANLPAQVEEIVATAKAVDKEYKVDLRRAMKLDDEEAELESRRFGDEATAKQYLSHKNWEHSQVKTQERRKAHMDKARDHLGDEDRARYDAVQAQVDAAGDGHAFEPGKDEQAATVCGWTPDEYRDMVEIEKIEQGRRGRTPEQQARFDELWLYNRPKPDLLAEQAAIVWGLSVDEYRELERLDKIGSPVRRYTVGGGRTDEQEARYQELRRAPGGAQGATPAQTDKLRARFDDMQSTHLDGKLDVAARREQIADLERQAGTLGAADAARLAEVRAENEVVSAKLAALGGETSASVEVPGSNGATLVIEAVQGEEEGGVDYYVDVRPAGADPQEWQRAGGGDPYMTDAAGARKAAKAIADLATAEPAATPSAQAA